MFTPKASSKQKMVKKAQKCKNRSSDSTHRRAYWTHGRASQCWAARMVRACRAHGLARLIAHIFWFFSFHHFARKIQTVNLISIPFSAMCSLHLALSHSTKTFMFITSQNSLLKITYNHLSFKSLKLVFHTKTQVSSQNFSQPKFIIKNRSSSIISHHNKNSPEIIKNHNSPLWPIFIQNSLNQQQLNHNFTYSNTQGIIYHQQHNITSIKA
jgi:hypothetical protein